jgi:hypothetical protein
MIKFIVFAAILWLTAYANLAAIENPRLSMALDSRGTPFLAWVAKEGDVEKAFVSKWDGNRWVPLGSALNRESKMSASYVSIALDGNDVPTVAWTERPSEQWSGFTAYSGKLFVARWSGSRWEPIGSALNRSDNTIADQPLLRLDSRGRPMIMWSEITSDFNVENVFFAQWDENAWHLIDDGTLSTDVSTSSRARDFVFDRHDQSILTWSQQLDSHKDFNVFVGHWNGTKWQRDYGTLNQNEARYAGAPAIALTKEDSPVVAFLQADKGFDLYVKTLKGSIWTSLGGSLNDRSGGANGPRIALRQDGSPVVAWLENRGREQVVVKGWDGSRWRQYGPPLNDGQRDALSCEVKIDPKGNPVVAWTELFPQGNAGIQVAWWDGETWSKHQLF